MGVGLCTLPIANLINRLVAMKLNFYPTFTHGVYPGVRRNNRGCLL